MKCPFLHLGVGLQHLPRVCYGEASPHCPKPDTGEPVSKALQVQKNCAFHQPTKALGHFVRLRLKMQNSLYNILESGKVAADRGKINYLNR